MKLVYTLLVSVVLAFSNICLAAVAPELSNKITHMIKSNLPDATVGVVVQDVATGEILYDYQGTKNFLPASTIKLFTAAAALKVLGPAYTFETSVYYKPMTIVDHVHQGDLALKFSGDPSLQLANLYSLLQQIKDAKIQKITGDLIIDDSIFTGPLWALGWTLDSTPWYHAAPVAAIIIDRNQFGITLIPSPKVGAKVNAKLDPAYPGAKFRTLTADVQAVTYEASENLCQILVDIDEKNNVALGGCWPVGTEPIHLRMAIKNPRLQATQFITEALEKLDIKLQGKIVFAKVAPGMVKLAHHSSEPLYILLRPILAESNNLYAESVIKTLGANLYGEGSFKTGSVAVRKVLSDMTGIDFKSARVLDGSGESRYNLITPRHLARLLYSMQQEHLLAGHFRNALGMSGMNGTLQKRFKKIPLIQAKTGSVNGVSTLAGYFTTNKKRDLIVAIMINQALESNVLLKQFEEDLCYYLVEQL